MCAESRETATQKTYTRYELTKNRLAEYIHDKYNVEDITFREINVVFIEGFYLFIRENYPCTHNTAMKFIQRFRTCSVCPQLGTNYF
uniref:phage integrase SAM-like domain-containing protein n=1 Tax=Phocaeicola sartorii TaxID=671267 RepID=UPI001FD061EA|nr:phage integrase SAM-like domain-containing protein [Phocaeicola sartorii]